MLPTPSPTLFDDTDDEEEYVFSGIPFPTDYNVYSTVNDKPDTTSDNTPIIQHAYPATVEETAQLNKIIDATQEIKNVVSVDEDEKEKEAKDENENDLVHDPQEAFDRLYPPSPPPYDLPNKAPDLKTDEDILDSDFLSELDFVFDHLAPDIEPLEALWKYELNDDMPENIFPPVTSMYGLEAKNKLRDLLFDFHEKASDLLAHEFAAVPMITGMYPKRRQVIYDDDGFVIDYHVRKIIETMYPPVDGPPWPYKLCEAYEIPHYKSELEYWTERPLNEDFFANVIRPCYHAARAEQDGDSDANADLQFQRRCNDYIIYELLWVLRGQITAIRILLNNFQLLHEWEARRINDHDFNMWQNFVDLCDDDPEETIDKAIRKATKRCVPLSNENDYMNNLSNNVHCKVCDFHLGKWGTRHDATVCQGKSALRQNEPDRLTVDSKLNNYITTSDACESNQTLYLDGSTYLQSQTAFTAIATDGVNTTDTPELGRTRQQTQQRRTFLNALLSLSPYSTTNESTDSSEIQQ
jgi:hypothetical protein